MEPGRQFKRLYHRTSAEAAEKIHTDGEFISREYTGDVYASNRLHGQAEGYGDAVVRLRVPSHLAHLDDEFPGGEKHYRINRKDIKPEHIIRPKK